MSISYLKKSHKSAKDTLARYKKAASNSKFQRKYEDERFWNTNHLIDAKTGTGHAVIRFLPEVEGEPLPWTIIYSYGFKGPQGKWYIENSLKTIGERDPCAQLNSRLWDSPVESDKKIAQAQSLRTDIICNILVVDDPVNPENNGKVFLFRMGPQIHNFIIKDAMEPEFGEEPFNPMDPWEGRNFNLRIVPKEMPRRDGKGTMRVPNYEKSQWDSGPSPIADSDKEIEAVIKQMYPLAPFTAASEFKSYDELQDKLVEVLGDEIGAGEIPVDLRESKPKKSSKPTKTVEADTPPKAEKTKEEPVAEAEVDVDEDEIDFDAMLADLDSD